MTSSHLSHRTRCARDSDWCDGLMCADIGNPGCPNSDIAAVGRHRGCIGPYPCGVGAGANGTDLPCDCEALAAMGQEHPPA